MQSFFLFIKSFSIPKKLELENALKNFTPKQFGLFAVSFGVAIISVVVLLAYINNYFMVSVPKDGGDISEGIIGIPTFVNPVLAISNPDKDLTTLVYSGLMRRTSEGDMINDLAESYEISDDKLTYTFKLKNSLTFHDKTPLTADDVIFTIEKIKDPLIKSPRKAQWDGVEVSKIDDSTVVFKLKQPYSSFINNTTLGILPEHIWKNVNASEFPLSGFNLKAIGSGPYMIDGITKNKEGTPESYSLSRFKKFALGVPHIKSLEIVSFANEKEMVDALISGSIDQAGGISPENTEKVLKAGYKIHTATLPRMFGLFFNSNENKIFSDKNVINAIEMSLNRQAIVDTVLYGHGSIIDNPVPSTILFNSNTNKQEYSIDKANKILDNAGWVMGTDGYRSKGGTTRTVTTTKKVKGKTIKESKTVSSGPKVPLSFSITTGDDAELDKSARAIKDELKKIGIQVEIENYEMGALNNLIRARKYQGLFFGQVVNNESDLYAFWHSSQRTDPGLNIALYSNPKVDSLLEKASKTLNEEEKNNIYNSFINEFRNDKPALFIYSPQYIYATEKSVSNIVLPTLTMSQTRFISIYSWYANSDHVWKIFTKN